MCVEYVQLKRHLNAMDRPNIRFWFQASHAVKALSSFKKAKRVADTHRS